MPSLIKRKNGRWYVQWFEQGVPKRKSLRTSDEKTARATFGDFDYNYRHGLLGLPGRKRVPLLSELFDEYLAFMENHREPRTYAHAKIYVEKFLRPAFGHIRADQLTNKHVEDFISQMKHRTTTDKNGKVVPAPYHPETINKRLKCLGAVYRRATRPGGVLDKMPVDIATHMLKVPQPLPKYVTPEEFAAWWPHINKPLNRWRAVIELCTSIPDSELAKLRWDKNYDEHFGALRYHRGKTKREILIALNEWAREAMKELWSMKDGPYIFHGIKEARKAYEVASNNSGIKVSPHMLRHSFATWALSAGEAMAKIQQILGHASISTTQRYARVIPRFLAQTTGAIDRMRPQALAAKAPKKAIHGKTVYSHKNDKNRSKH